MSSMTHLMDRLQVAVGEVRGHLADSLLVGQGGLGRLLPGALHHEAHQVVAADLLELHGLLLLGLGLHHQQGDGEQDRPEALGGLPELAARRHLVGGLQPAGEEDWFGLSSS